MFLGEALCYLAFRIQMYRDNKKGIVQPEAVFNRFILMLPASCDMTATSIMYVGLTLTTPSAYQMLRGSVVVFTGLLSWWFLKRKLLLHHWVGMGLVVVGTVVVGMAGLVCKADDGDARNPGVGNLLVVLAQLVVSVQMVIEEKVIGGYKIPALQVVGWEGIFGFCMLFCVLCIMQNVPQPALLSPTKHKGKHFEDSISALKDMGHHPGLLAYSLGSVISIAFFNFFGVSITKHLNAATRMVLDSLRTVIVWAVSLILKWEKFCYINVIGFIVLVAGTVVFNEIVYIPGLMPPKTEETEAKPLLDVEKLDLAGPSPIVPTSNVILTPTMTKLTTTKQR